MFRKEERGDRMLQSVLSKLFNRHNLCEYEIRDTMNFIMDGLASPAQIGAFLAALKFKGETITEIAGSAKVLREKVSKIELKQKYAIDTCGTGGDGAQTFNISTVVGFVVAAAGVPVVKHGNRSVSSRCGSADVLEYLGVNLDLKPSVVATCVNDINFGFAYAPSFHKAMKHVAQPRKEIGIRTIFNVLGPLINPAHVLGQILGVFNPDLTELMAEVLRQLGCERALVVHGLDGLDEITITTKTKVSELKDNKITTYELNPLDYGIPLATRHDLVGGNARENATILLDILQGKLGPQRDIVLLNAGAAIYVGKQAETIQEGIHIAKTVIDQGLAYEKLRQLISLTKAGVCP